MVRLIGGLRWAFCWAGQADMLDMLVGSFVCSARGYSGGKNLCRPQYVMHRTCLKYFIKCWVKCFSVLFWDLIIPAEILWSIVGSQVDKGNNRYIVKAILTSCFFQIVTTVYSNSLDARLQSCHTVMVLQWLVISPLMQKTCFQLGPLLECDG